MKSYNPSFSPARRALLAATVVLTTGTLALHAQSSSNRNQNQPNPYGSASSSNTQNSQYGSSTTGGSTSQGQYGSATAGSNDQRSSANPYGTSTSNQSAQMSGSSDDRSENKLGWGDRRFVTKASDSGQEEVHVAQLASQKANNPDVRRFAQQLVQDHSQVNQELMSLASSKNVKIDQEDNKGRIHRRLNNASGQEFDREFIEYMVDQHESDVKLFEKAARDAKDNELRQFASRHVDHLRQHLSQAQQLQRSIVPTGNQSSWQSSSDTNTSGSSSNVSGGTGSTGTSNDTTQSSGTSSGFGSGSDSGSGSSGTSSGATGSSTSTTR